MSAVATKHCGASPRPESQAKPVDRITNAQHAFAEIGVALTAACGTDEPHGWSGDSDRLLRIAADIAEREAQRIYEGQDAEHRAYDIAALIKAARLVPGDTESSSRAALLATAELHLAVLTEDAACLRIGATRPPSPSKNTQGASEPATSTDAEDLTDAAMALNGLVDWVISANDLLQDMRTRSLHDPAFAEVLDTRGIRVNCADWASCDMTNAMSYVLGHQKSLIMKLMGSKA